MIEKKTATIAVLCVATVLLLGLWSNSAQEARTLNSKYVKVVEDYNRLTSDYLNLETEKANLERDYSKLKTEKVNLEKDYSWLKIENTGLNKDYSSLYANYNLLKSDYDTIKSDYDTIKKEYDEMSPFFNGAKAIAESAEWVSEDGRLKVTSELIISGTYWTTYTVRVTITNIGNEPIDKVVIFLFPYSDGKFAETYSGYEYHSVESLYMGETYSYDFTYLTKDMTSYKVLAVVG